MNIVLVHIITHNAITTVILYDIDIVSFSNSQQHSYIDGAAHNVTPVSLYISQCNDNSNSNISVSRTSIETRMTSFNARHCQWTGRSCFFLQQCVLYALYTYDVCC